MAVTLLNTQGYWAIYTAIKTHSMFKVAEAYPKRHRAPKKSYRIINLLRDEIPSIVGFLDNGYIHNISSLQGLSDSGSLDPDLSLLLAARIASLHR